MNKAQIQVALADIASSPLNQLSDEQYQAIAEAVAIIEKL